MLKIFRGPSLKLFAIICLTFCYSALADSQYSFTTQAPIYVVGDIHGAFEELHTSLRTLKLIDEHNNWSGGEAHFVSLGDLTDRGPSSRKVIDLLMHLQTQAKLAGGRVHVVLGNHEVMNLTGDRRYLSKQEIAEFAQDESPALRAKHYQYYLTNTQTNDNSASHTAFNQTYPAGYFAHLNGFNLKGKYGQWLTALPFVIQINDQVFTHGGLSSKLKGLSLKELNDGLRKTLLSYLQNWQDLTDSHPSLINIAHHDRANALKSLQDSPQKQAFLAAETQLLFSMDSPTWYRGNAYCHPYFEAEILSNILSQWNASRLWVGHSTTPTRQVLHRLNGQLIVMDTGMLNSYYKGSPWAAKIEADQSYTLINGLTGKLGQASESAKRHFDAPYNMTDAQLESFLLEANVTSLEELTIGKTKPIRVTLEKDGKSLKAVFKYYDSDPGSHSGRWDKSIRNPDRFSYEVAAYKLDRMLDIGLVPVTVLRTIKGMPGSLQLWLDNLVSEKQRREQDLEYDGFCNEKAQDNMMNVFDYLIRNSDRNMSNMLYSYNDWQVWFIDHSRSFGIKKRMPPMLRNLKIKLTDEFRAALKSLTLEQLRALRPYMHNRQIKTLWYRREQLLAGET
ncbi:metallophosphoesterase [Paraglaciecola aestuariivivens]